LIFGSNRKQ